MGAEPCWTKEPSMIEIQALIERNKAALTKCSIRNLFSRFFKAPPVYDVTFLGQGALNKLYRISDGKSKEEIAVLRVALPVDPVLKTQSEVATLRFMRHYGKIPVPTVRKYNSTNSDSIGFEWILMDLMPGATLHKRWNTTTLCAKKEIVNQVAGHLAAMFHHTFEEIGSLFPSTSEKNRCVIRQVVSNDFFWRGATAEMAPRGPFKTTGGWIEARLKLKKIHSEKVLRGESEGDCEDAEKALKIVARLENLVSRFFPDTPLERTILFHDDLSTTNILVDNDGKLTAIIDWECVSALPLWRACHFPEFLKGSDRRLEPLRESYDKTETGEPDDCYYQDLEDYELTQLRSHFLEVMEKLEPEWMREFHSNQILRDFDFAVTYCDDEMGMYHIKRWLDDVEGPAGSFLSLKDRIARHGLPDEVELE